MRTRRPVGKPPARPWYSDCRARLRLERGLGQHPLRVRRDYLRRGGCKGVRYRTEVDVPMYGRRRVEIVFDRRGDEPRVYADGPTDSPHRYDGPDDDGRLCMWHPHDPDDRKWVAKDGLLALVGMTARHLLCEGWYRETDEWLGSEAGHTANNPPPRWWRRARGR